MENAGEGVAKVWNDTQKYIGRWWKGSSILTTWRKGARSFVQGGCWRSMLEKGGLEVCTPPKFNRKSSPEKLPKPNRKPDRLPVPPFFRGFHSLAGENFGGVIIASDSLIVS